MPADRVAEGGSAALLVVLPAWAAVLRAAERAVVLVSGFNFSVFLVFLEVLLALETAPDAPWRVGNGLAGLTDFDGLRAWAGVDEGAAAVARGLALAPPAAGLAGAEDGIFPVVPAVLPGFAAGTGGAK